MPVLQCPACGFSGELPNVPREASVKCRKCGTIFIAVRPRWFTKVLLSLPVFLLFGAGVSLVFHLQHRRSQSTAVTTDDAGSEEMRMRAKAERLEAEQRAKREAEYGAEQGKIENETRDLEAAREKLASARAALEKERKSLDQQAKELQDRKAKLVQEQDQLKATAAKTNPALVLRLEELDKLPEKYYGQYMVCDGATIQGKAIEKHKELDRYTIGVVSPKGTYYSRVPVGGLFFSTTDTIALALPRHLNNDGVLSKVRVYCEVRKYEKKAGTGKALPEAHIYRVDLFTINGDLSKVLE